MVIFLIRPPEVVTIPVPLIVVVVVVVVLLPVPLPAVLLPVLPVSAATSPFAAPRLLLVPIRAEIDGRRRTVPLCNSVGLGELCD